MTKLIIEEGGERRGYKIGRGKLTLGSGAEAKLRIADPNVAAVHAELEVAEKRAVLRLRPGVLPATQAGRPLGSEILLAHGSPIELGGARLWIEYEGGAPVAVPAAAQAAPAPPAAPKPVARAATRRAAGDDDGAERGRRAAYRERKQRENTARWVALLVGVPVIGIGAWFALGKLTGSSADEVVFIPAARYQTALEHFREGSYGLAEEVLEQGLASPEAGPELKAQMLALQQEIAAGRASGRELAHNLAGDRWLEAKLVAYEQNWLSGTPAQPEMRLFVQRLRDFKHEWPTHPEMDWVDRQLARFEPLVDLAKPPTWADVDFEARMTAGLRRNRITGEEGARGDAEWKDAIRTVELFLEGAEGADRENALLLLDELRTKRDAWVADKLQQARFHFERAEQTGWDSAELGRSIAWLVKIVLDSGDPAAEDDAARRILLYQQSADLLAFLRGYRRDRPEDFELLAANRVLGPFLEEHGLLED